MKERPTIRDPVMDSIARECVSPVRGCLTDEQYRELVERITRALQAERSDRGHEHR